jgi:hypothetical protein
MPGVSVCVVDFGSASRSVQNTVMCSGSRIASCHAATICARSIAGISNCESR